MFDHVWRRCHLFPEGIDNGVVVTEEKGEAVGILLGARDAA